MKLVLLKIIVQKVNHINVQLIDNVLQILQIANKHKLDVQHNR